MGTFALSLRIAASAIARNRLRTVLTAIGISVGIAAVMCTVAIGQGSADAIRQRMSALGDNFLLIRAGSRNLGGVRTGYGGASSLTPDDARAIVRNVPLVAECSPQVNSRSQLVAGGENWNTTIRGIAPTYLDIRRWIVDRGAAFGTDDVTSQAKVCLLGDTVASTLFPDTDPIGRDVRIGRFVFTVDGVLQPRGATGAGDDQDDQILMPYTTAQHNLTGSQSIDAVLCAATSDADIAPAQSMIESLLRYRHDLPPDSNDDFAIRSPQEYMALREQSAQTMGLMLSGVAAVSLLVGGIGVMNIMLVSVTERTREIGLRMAIGAREAHIRWQFLAEALLLGLVGGVSGVTLGFVGAQVLTRTLGWSLTLTPNTIVVAALAATAVGVVFGYLPASRAAALDPIVALRVEN